MLFFAFVLAQSALEADAKPALLEALGHYQKLDSFSMSIEHRESSGLFPGTYTQSLKWKKGGRFELLVTKPQTFAKESPSTTEAPNYYADGKNVVSIWRDGRRSERSLANQPNLMPGWEVSGGLILSYLQNTGVVTLFSNPPKEMGITFAFGQDKTWEGEPARDIRLTVHQGDQSSIAHIYLAAAKPIVLGISVKLGPDAAPGIMYFRNQIENPVLPNSLGKAP